MATRRSISGPQLSRREFLASTTAAALTLLAPRGLRAEAHEKEGASRLPEAARSAAAKSPLIYISPLKRDGSESRCHGEVWFVTDGDDLLVVTAPSRWRAAAISKGLDEARIWVGDFGVWTRAEGRFRDAPNFVARASIDAEPAAHAKALAAFGSKYSDEWSKWRPRFKDGLASGKRVMIRYHSR